MTSAGWYPDPAGQPQTYRYWDGNSWHEETTSNPYDPPPVSAQQQPSPPPPPPPTQQAYGGPQPPQPPQPTPYGGYGPQPPYPGAPGGPPAGKGGGAGKTIAIVLAVVLLVVALGVGGFLGVRALTGDDDTTADDNPTEAATDTTQPTDPTDTSPETTAPESTDGLTPTTQQCNAGNPVGDPPVGDVLQGGGLSVPVPKGYDVDTLGTATVFTFADGVQLAIRQIEENWISIYGVGGVPRGDGIESTAQAAEIVTQCMTGSENFYSGFTGRTDLENGPVTVAGAEAHSILTEVRVDDPKVQAEGDVLQVVVVDTGDPAVYGLYVGMVPIGDEQLIEQQQAVFQKLRVG